LIEFKDNIRNHWKKIIIVFIYTIGLIVFLLPQPNLPCANILSRENAILEIQSNGDFLIFHGTLFIACVVGIIELLPELKKARNWEKILFSLLYFVFVGGISLSFSRACEILRENYGIISSGIIGTDIRNWSQQTTFYGIYSNLSILGIIGIIVINVFWVLLFFVLQESHNDCKR
jgi:hypothetical protein